MSCHPLWSRPETQENSGPYRTFWECMKFQTVLSGAFRRSSNPRVVSPHAHRARHIAHMNEVGQVNDSRER